MADHRRPGARPVHPQDDSGRETAQQQA
jgi:hypothetical protein